MRRFLLITATVILAVVGTFESVAADEQMIITPAPLYTSTAGILNPFAAIDSFYLQIQVDYGLIKFVGPPARN